jgi:hypothetical protein
MASSCAAALSPYDDTTGAGVFMRLRRTSRTTTLFK